MSGILISGTRRLWTLTPPCSSSRFSFKQQSIRFPSSWNASLSLRSRWQSTAAHAFKAAAAETAPIVAPVARITETRRIVGHHMLWTSAFVFSMVVVGGLTRLTESGLSMVDWSLLGSRPPQTQQEWEAYFQKYKQFPEYQLLNQNMTVDEFKQIFWFEYGHRMLGRFIGAFFALPGLYFIARGYVTPSVRNRILVISGLIGFQGLLGWYMVKSGLDEQIIHDKAVPRVSQYRLSAHLGSAFVIYLLTFVTGLSILTRRPDMMTAVQRQIVYKFQASPVYVPMKKAAHTMASFVFITALSGAFVAGLDAGLIYNTFPKMGTSFIPSDLISPYIEPIWKNIFENPTTVQFEHRVLAMTTYTGIVALWLWGRRHRALLPRNVSSGLNIMMAVASLQVSLGVSTLLWFVPVPLAAAHQAGSLTLLTVMAYVVHALKRVPK